jgi:AcrR family transcriptional regulator
VQVAPVAQRAGIATGTVYRYFPSKTELVTALVAAISEHETARCERPARRRRPALGARGFDRDLRFAPLCANRRLPGPSSQSPSTPSGKPCALPIAARWRRIADPHRRRDAGGAFANSGCRPCGASLVGALLEGLIGPLAPGGNDDPARARDAVQTLTLLSLRALGVVDARARGLVVQIALPAPGEGVA